MRNRFGLLNEIHLHDGRQSDRPNVLTRFFGEEGLVERGVELTWVAPLPFFLELLGGVFNGDNEEAFGYGKLNEPLLTGRVRTFFELERLGRHPARRLGGERRRPRSAIAARWSGVDAEVQVPAGRLDAPARSPWAARRSTSTRRVNEVGEDVDGDGIADTRRREAHARPLGLVRLRRGPAVAALGFRLALRLDGVPGGARPRVGGASPTSRSCPRSSCASGSPTSTPSGTSATASVTTAAARRIVDELLLQATFILGAHPAHPF